MLLVADATGQFAASALEEAGAVCHALCWAFDSNINLSWSSGSEGGRAGKKGNPGREASKDPTPAKTKGLVKTASGQLRASAAEFIPRISSDNSLSRQVSGSLPDAASVAASSAPNIAMLPESTASAAASGVQYDTKAADPAAHSMSPGAHGGSHAFPDTGGHTQEGNASLRDNGHAAGEGSLLMAQDHMTLPPKESPGLPAHESAVAAGAAAAPPERVVGFREPAPSEAHGSPQTQSSPGHAAATAADAPERMTEGTEQEPRHTHLDTQHSPSSQSWGESQPAHPQRPSGNAATHDLLDEGARTDGASAAILSGNAAAPDLQDGGDMAHGMSAAVMEREPQPQSALPRLAGSVDSPNSAAHPNDNGAVQADSSKSSSHSALQAGADSPAHELMGSGTSPAAAVGGGASKAANVNADGVPAAI